MESATNKGDTKKRDKKLIILILIIAAVAVIGIIILISNPGKTQYTLPDTEVPLSGISMAMDDNAVDYSGEEPVDKTPQAAGIKIPGYGRIDIPAGEADVNVVLLNPEGNPCNFKFELILTETGETLFSSDLVAPGKCLEKITMSKPLDDGEYDAMVKIRAYNPDDQSEMNGAEVATILNVRQIR